MASRGKRYGYLGVPKHIRVPIQLGEQVSTGHGSQMRLPSSRSMAAQPVANMGPHFAYLSMKIVDPCLQRSAPLHIGNATRQECSHVRINLGVGPESANEVRFLNDTRSQSVARVASSKHTR